MPGEEITSISGSAGYGFDSITFKTSKGRVLGPYGFDYETNGPRWSFTGPIYGFYGTTCSIDAGCLLTGGNGVINGLGIYTAASSPTPPPPPILQTTFRKDVWTALYSRGKSPWDDGLHPGTSVSTQCRAPVHTHYLWKWGIGVYIGCSINGFNKLAPHFLLESITMCAFQYKQVGLQIHPAL
jgi:hypothetical protein